MILELLVFALVLLVPPPLGYLLARKRPAGKPWKHALIAALPVSLPFFGFALWITVTSGASADTQAAEFSQVLAMALYVVGVVTFVTGMGLGLLGDAWARKTRAGREAE